MRVWLVLFVVLTSVSFTSVPTARKKTFNLTVKITNVKGEKGIMELGLYDGPEHYAEVGKTFRQIRKPISGKELTCTFYDLPEKRYGICTYHDENSNNKCDKNFFGVPTEAYAFSNNIRPVFSIPKFEDCSFLLNEHRTIYIKLVY